MRKFLLSFFSPCGRLGRLGFWWRQLALAPLIFLGGFASSLGALWQAHACVFSMLPKEGAPLNDVAAVAEIICCETFPNMLAAGWGGVEAEYMVPKLLAHPDAAAPLTPESLVLIGLALLLPVAWCTLALTLRRLRDTRPGLWLLPLCFALPWVALVDACTDAPKPVLGIVFYATLALGHVFLCLPSRNTPPQA